jgi:calcium/proton exchanger cax
LVKASIAGVIVANTLFMLGASFLLGGLKHHLQEYNRASARLQAGLLFLATVALLIPSALAEADSATPEFIHTLSLGLSALLIVSYALGLLFSLRTHRDSFGGTGHGESGETPWPMGLALSTLAGVTVLVALVSEVFVESVQHAAAAFGMSPAFVGFVIVALVGGAAEFVSAFSGARNNRLDLSVGMVRVVRRSTGRQRILGLRDDALPASTSGELKFPPYTPGRPAVFTGRSRPFIVLNRKHERTPIAAAFLEKDALCAIVGAPGRSD